MVESLGVGVGDLQVVPEDLVEAHLERRDAGAVALALLQGGDVLLAAVAEVAQLVELGVVAGADHVAVGEDGGGSLGEAGGELLAQVGGLVMASSDSRTSTV